MCFSYFSPYNEWVVKVHKNISKTQLIMQKIPNSADIN